MTRNKKPTRKYNPIDKEIRINYSPTSKGHPNVIFGETAGGKYKSLGITSESRSTHKKIKLNKNIDPNNNDDCFVLVKTRSANKKYFSDIKDNFVVSEEDKPIIRQLIKK